MYASDLKRVSGGVFGSPEHTRPRVGDDMNDHDTVPGALVAQGTTFPPPPGLAAASSAQAPQVQLHALDTAALNRLIIQQNELMQMFLRRSEQDAQQPAPSPAGAPSSTEDPVGSIGKLSKMIANKITSEGGKLKKLLHRVAASQSYIEKLEQHIELCSKGTLPPNCKPFSLPFQCDEWGCTLDGDDGGLLIVPAKASDSFEEIARKLHMESTASRLILNRLVELRRLARLKAEASLSNFIAVCSSVAAQEKDMMEKLARGIQAGSAAAPVSFQAEITEACTKCYQHQLRAIATEKLKIEADKAHQREKEDRALQAAALLPVEEVVKRGLKELLKKKSPKKFAYDKESQVLNFAEFLNFDAAVGDEAKAIAQKQLNSKNELTPGGGRGHNSSSSGPMKARSWSKGNGKGKGKGVEQKDPNTKNINQNTSRTDKGKGKGKGKTKNKSPNKGKGKGSNPQKADGGKGGKKGSKNGGGQAKNTNATKGS